MITIVADKAANELGRVMLEKVVETGEDTRYFCLKDMKIEPCYACQGCEKKTYGRCVVRDDADVILPCILRSKTIVVLTPIVFGSYSFQIKRMVDKFKLIGDLHYGCHGGELVIGKPAGVRYYAIGIHNGDDASATEEVSVFRQLIRETARLASWGGRAIVMPYDANEFDDMIQEVAGL